MGNASNKILSPLPVGKSGKLKKQSTYRHHPADDGKSSLEAEMVRALGALRSIRSKKKHLAEQRLEMQILSSEAKEK